jgi:murein L,D-transpeptidase YafK
MSFWKDIKEGYDRFEIAKAPPSWDVCGKEYVFGVPSGTTLEAAGACPAAVAEWIPASVKSKMAADDAAVATEVAALAAREAKAVADTQKAAEAEAAAKARGEAIGSFIGGLFGGAQPAPQAPAATPDPNAPVPAPRPDRV